MTGSSRPPRTWPRPTGPLSCCTLPTSLRRPPSPVPAIMPVRSAAFAIAALGTPESAPKDMSPRYIGEESISGEPGGEADRGVDRDSPPRRVGVLEDRSDRAPCLSSPPPGARARRVARPVSASCLMWRIFHLVQNSLDLDAGKRHVALEFDRLSLRQTGDL